MNTLDRPTDWLVALTRETWHRALEHCRAGAPAECVGFIAAGSDGVGRTVAPLPNVGGMFEFRIDPRDQYEVERSLAARGLHILAIYHSHPGGGDQLSSDDIKFARAWRCAHLVIALRLPFAPDSARAYSVSAAGQVQELALQIDS